MIEKKRKSYRKQYKQKTEKSRKKQHSYSGTTTRGFNWTGIAIVLGVITLAIVLVCLFKSCTKKTTTVSGTTTTTTSVVSAASTVSTVPPPEDESGQETTDDDGISQEDPVKELTGDFEMHFIDVGQGDATLVVCDGEAMLVDAGNEYRGTVVQLYLKKQGITGLKYAFCTHPDSDHIGGMDVIVTKYDIETEKVYMNGDGNELKAYAELRDAATYRGYEIEKTVAGDKYTLGGAEIEVLGPLRQYENGNNNSLVLLVTYGNTRFLLTGDAGEQPEAELVDAYDVRADVLKIGHHGSHYSTSELFYNEVLPEYAVISVGADNTYGHPAERVTELLNAGGTIIYRTDLNGSIVVRSDGTKLDWRVSKNDSPTETDLTDSGVGEETETATYVVNGYSRKFHLPYCEMVQNMSERNRIYTDMSREECIDSGLIPCGRCNP